MLSIPGNEVIYCTNASPGWFELYCVCSWAGGEKKRNKSGVNSLYSKDKNNSIYNFQSFPLSSSLRYPAPRSQRAEIQPLFMESGFQPRRPELLSTKVIVKTLNFMQKALSVLFLLLWFHVTEHLSFTMAKTIKI